MYIVLTYLCMFVQNLHSVWLNQFRAEATLWLISEGEFSTLLMLKSFYLYQKHCLHTVMLVTHQIFLASVQLQYVLLKIFRISISQFCQFVNQRLEINYHLIYIPLFIQEFQVPYIGPPSIFTHNNNHGSEVGVKESNQFQNHPMSFCG